MKIKQITLALLIALAAVAGTTGNVRAEDNDEVLAKQEQECKQVVETECEAGAYGQVTNCKTKAEQVCKQKQKVAKAGGRVLAKVHDASEIGTSLDLQSTLAVVGILTTGAGAYALKRKIK